MNKINAPRGKEVPLLLKISTIIFSTAILLSAVCVNFQLRTDRRTMADDLDAVAERMIVRLPETIVYPMFNYLDEEVEHLISDVFSDELVIGAEVWEEGVLTIDLKADDFDDQSKFSKSRKIIFTDDDEKMELGSVVLYFTTETLGQDIVSHIKRTIIEELLFVLVIVLLNAVLLNRIVVKPIKATSRLLYSISEGEGDLTRRLEVASNDEIGELARHFNSFASKLNSTIAKVKLNLTGTLNIKDELSSHTRETVAAVEQMISSIKSGKQKILNMNDIVVDSVSGVNLINERIDDTVSSITDQSAMVEQTRAAVTSMLSSIDSVAQVSSRKKATAELLVESSGAGSIHVDDTFALILEVAESVDKIEDMLELINSIASQTNILSINAAIEAAHAGQSGKGFAVVADEIRKLAESSGANAKSISNELTDMIRKIEAASEKGGTLRTVFDQIETEVNSVADSFDEISSTMQELSSGSAQIQDAMTGLSGISADGLGYSKEMKAGARTLDLTVTEVGNVSASVTGAMEELVLGTRDIGSELINIKDLNHELGFSSEDLRMLVDGFITEN